MNTTFMNARGEQGYKEACEPDLKAAAATTMKKQKIIKNTKLRILAFSDLHGNEAAMKALARKAKKADVIICAGDFTVFENNILRIMRMLDGFGKHVLLVNGNHEDETLVTEICNRLSNLKNLNKRMLLDKNFPNLVFVGHGGEGFDLVSRDFENFARKAIPRIKKLKKEGREVIFVTHQPPHNTKLDYIWAHHGNKSYSRFDREVQPLLHVCGHLHETQGKHDRIKKTLIINPGPKGEVIKIKI